MPFDQWLKRCLALVGAAWLLWGVHPASRAALFASHDATVAVVLQPGRYPLSLRFGQHNAARLEHNLVATSPHAAPLGRDGLVFLARGSRSGGGLPQPLLCTLRAREKACGPNPFTPDSPLTPGELPDVIMGLRGQGDALVAASWEPDTGRVVSQSTPLPAAAVGVAEGRVVVLTRPAPTGAALHLFTDGQPSGPPAPCPWGEAVFSLGRYQEWLLVTGRLPAPPPPPAPTSLPTLPAGAPVAGLAALYSTTRGVLLNPVNFPLGALPPGQNPVWRLFPGQEAGRYTLCFGRAGCRELTVNENQLAVGPALVMAGREAVPVGPQRWLAAGAEGGRTLLEWLSPQGELQSSLALGPGLALGQGDDTYCRPHGCQPWVLTETPLAASPVISGGAWLSPVGGLALTGGGAAPVTLWERGLIRGQWPGPRPFAPPLWLKDKLLVLAQGEAALYDTAHPKALWRGAAPFAQPPLTLVLGRLGEGGLLAARGGVLALFKPAARTFKTLLRLGTGGRWLSLGHWGAWAQAGGKLVFSPNPLAPAKGRRAFVLPGRTCLVHADGAGAVSLCGDQLSTHPLRGRGVTLRLPRSVLPARRLLATGNVVYVVHRSAGQSATSPFGLKVYSRDALSPGVPLPMIGMDAREVDALALVDWPQGACLLSAARGTCLSAAGQTLPVFVDPAGQGAEALFSRLGLPPPRSSLVTLQSGGLLRRDYTLPDGSRWASLSRVVLDRGHATTLPEWEMF